MFLGQHKIEVLHLDKPVSGSPFTSEAFDASKVIIEKIKSTNFVINEKIIFTCKFNLKTNLQSKLELFTFNSE